MKDDIARKLSCSHDSPLFDCNADTVDTVHFVDGGIFFKR